MPDLVATAKLLRGATEPFISGDAPALWQNLKFSKKLGKRKVNTSRHLVAIFFYASIFICENNGLLAELQSWT